METIVGASNAAFTCAVPRWAVLLRGQLISLLIAGTGIFATFLSSDNANFPTMMALFNYILLSTYLIRKFWRGSSDQDNIREQKSKPMYWYFFAAVLDMEANFLVIMAYNYTSITSIMLLDCFTIPSSIILSYVFLEYKYSYRHIGGALVCILGLCVIVTTDALVKSPDSPKNAFLGDVFCLVGSVLYAASNVMQEHIVKENNREEYLGYLGLFGAITAAIQCYFVDFRGILKCSFSSRVIGFVIGFVSCLFCMYTNTSMFLVDGDATFFNLSLLTSDVYAVVFSYLFTGALVHWSYSISFVLVMCGLALYHSEVPPDFNKQHSLELKSRQSSSHPSVEYDTVINMFDTSGHSDIDQRQQKLPI